LNEFLIAPCGINCRICVAYLRDRNKCPGCRESDAKKPITRVKCKIKTCENFIKNKYCSECKKFPCVNIKHLDKRYSTKYHMSVVENLENIKKLGVDEFLKNEKTKWKCAGCGGIICAHKGVCFNCGKPLI
jgi:hypothetical protein